MLIIYSIKGEVSPKIPIIVLIAKCSALFWFLIEKFKLSYMINDFKSYAELVTLHDCIFVDILYTIYNPGTNIHFLYTLYI